MVTEKEKRKERGLLNDCSAFQKAFYMSPHWRLWVQEGSLQQHVQSWWLHGTAEQSVLAFPVRSVGILWWLLFWIFFFFFERRWGRDFGWHSKWDSWWQRCHLISLQVVTCLKLLRTQSQTFLPRRVTVPGTWNSQTGLQRAEWGVRTAPASSPPARSPSASSLGKGYVTWLGRPG